MSEENNNNGGNGGSGDGAGGGAGDGKPEFKAPASQEEFDRMVADRINRVQSKYSDYDDIKKKADAHDKAMAEAMTEQEKAVAAARSEGEKTAQEKADARIVKSEAKVIASKLKFRDASDAVAFVDLSKVKVGDDGEPDASAIEDLLKKLATDKPYLLDDGKKPTPRVGDLKSGAAAEDTSGMTGKQKTAAALRQLRNGG